MNNLLDYKKKYILNSIGNLHTKITKLNKISKSIKFKTVFLAIRKNNKSIINKKVLYANSIEEASKKFEGWEIKSISNFRLFLIKYFHIFKIKEI